MKNITTVKSSSAAFFTGKQIVWPEKNIFKGEFNFNLSYFLNAISESAPKMKDPVKSYQLEALHLRKL